MLAALPDFASRRAPRTVCGSGHDDCCLPPLPYQEESMSWQALFGERATTKIAAIYDTREAASGAAVALSRIAGLEPSQWTLIAPHEQGFARKLEPEIQGIARTGVRAHLILGAVGLLAGA